jgi:hypothetical protein
MYVWMNGWVERCHIVKTYCKLQNAVGQEYSIWVSYHLMCFFICVGQQYSIRFYMDADAGYLWIRSDPDSLIQWHSPRFFFFSFFSDVLTYMMISDLFGKFFFRFSPTCLSTWRFHVREDQHFWLPFFPREKGKPEAIYEEILVCNCWK